METTARDASFGRILCGSIKTLGKRPKTYVVTRTDRFAAEDFSVVKPIVEELNKHDMIVSYYGAYFDIPILNTRVLKYGLPALRSDIKSADLFFVMKRNFKLASKSLEAACDFLGIKGKTSLDPSQWARGHVYDPKAMAYITRHNRQDVIILERLYNRVVPYLGQLHTVRY